MYYEFKIENGWEYYALIKAKDEKEAYKVYNENICKTNILKKKILVISTEKALSIYNRNNNENRIATLKEFENDQIPLIVLLDNVLQK